MKSNAVNASIISGLITCTAFEIPYGVSMATELTMQDALSRLSATTSDRTAGTPDG